MKHRDSHTAQQPVNNNNVIRKAAPLLFIAILSSGIAFAQVTKNDKQPPVKANITSAVQTAINSNQTTVNPVPVHVATTRSGTKLFAVISGGKVIRFDGTDSKGNPTNTSVQRTSSQNSTGLTCSICIRDVSREVCYDVDCDVVLKVPKKIQ